MSGFPAIAALVIFSSWAALSHAQNACHLSLSPPAADSRNLFTLTQEEALGDAVAESELLDLRILSEGDSHLQQIAARLVRDTPLAALHIRTFVVDIPEANAFVLPGGRVYVSRSLLSLLENEDELAGILAHELGHLLAHQQAIGVSRLMQAVLGVTSPGDRRDVFDKYAQILENSWRKPSLAATSSEKEEKDQMEADRLGLAMQLAAGYDPAAQIRALDRFLQTKGKTGNFLSNLFNFTPNQKRLGELVKSLPPGCTTSHTAASPDYAAWRKSVLDHTSPQYSEALPPTSTRLPLQSPIRDDLRQIRFSPDGRFVFAQDDVGITVLTVQPFQIAFRIPAEKVSEADFTPDSKEIVFLSSATHMERWDVASQARIDSTDILVREHCSPELLSPDGRTVACQEANGKVTLLDVATGETIFEKKDFGVILGMPMLTDFAALLSGDSNASQMAFSPDSRYFLAFPLRGGANPLAFDLKEKNLVPLRGELKKAQHPRFVFLDTERLMLSPIILGVAAGVNVKAMVVSFPGGEILSTPALPNGPLFRTADPSRVIVRPMGKLAAAAIEYSTGQGVSSRVPAIDFRGQFYVAERISGELALYEKGNKVVATARLPDSELHGLRSLAVSNDLNWIAFSLRSRAGVWNLRTGQALAEFRAFDGGYFDPNGALLADFPKLADAERRIVQLQMNPLRSVNGPEIKTVEAQQKGAYIVDEHANFTDPTLDVLDAHTLKPLWSKHFPNGPPALFVDPDSATATFLWNSSSERVKRDPLWKSRVKKAEASVHLDQHSCGWVDFFRHSLTDRSVSLDSNLLFFEFVDLATGENRADPLMANVVDHCLRIKSLLPFGQSVVIEDNRHRILIFTAGDAEAEPGQARLRFFGHLLDVDRARKRIAVAKEAGRVVVYDAINGAQIDEFRFPASLVTARFANDGKMLLALTSKQEAITITLK